MYVQRIDMVDGDYAPDGTYQGVRHNPCGVSLGRRNCIYMRRDPAVAVGRAPGRP
jgi:hypothetical protein